MTLSSNIENQHGLAAESLRSKTAALVSQFLNGEEISFIRQYSRIIDEYFLESFEKSIVGPRLILNKHPFAIIALGGYGREEQCIHSDIDLLLLFEKRVPEVVEDLIREMVYPLWDLGLDVGHATRTLKECVSIAKEDIEVLTSLLDARFVCGMSPLFSKLLDQLRKKIIKRHENKIIAWLIERNRQRHTYFGDSVYLLEANLKEGRGGLRDYHTMLWIARIKSNLRQYRDLEYHGYLSHDEFRSLTESLTFIWNVRNHLHHIAGRKCDRLHFEFQIKMADALKFKKENGQAPVESFLSRLHGHMETLKQLYFMLMYELGYSKTSLRRRRKRTEDTLIKGLKVTKDGMLNFESPETILSTPDLLMKIFEESANLKIPLSAESKRLVREFDNLVDHRFSSSAWNVKSFERILSAIAPTFNALNEMLNCGFLVRFIPEMKGIINRIQYDEYHLYPVDRHSLRTVDIIKKIGTTEDISKDPLCIELYKKLKTRTLLLWAALLHDIGKGDPGINHSESGALMARSILKQKGYKPEFAETVSFLIEHHLLLIKAATRRDILDEETAIYCARKIKDVQRLEMLYILTAADSMATGPKAWNDWISALLRDLFFKILNILQKGELATHEAVEVVDKKTAEIIRSSLDGKAAQEMESLLGVMSPRYLLYTPADKILEHAELFKHIGNADFVWKITHPSRSNTRTVTICAHDRPGLFAKIAGTFTLNNLDILDAQIFTWRNNIALDIFEVKPPPDQIFETEQWQRAEKHLQSALSGKLDLSIALQEKMAAYRSPHRHTWRRPHRIVVDNDTSSFFTIIEVFAYDFPGLLYSITDALFRCKLDIWVAKIATKVDQVVDVFYVRDFDGQKVDSPDHVAAIKTAIQYVLPEIGTAKTKIGLAPKESE